MASDSDKKKIYSREEIIRKAEDAPFLTGGLISCAMLLGIEIYSDRVGETARLLKFRTFTQGIFAACVLLGLGTKISNEYMFNTSKKKE